VPFGRRVAVLGSTAVVAACLLASCSTGPTAAQKKAVRSILTTTTTTPAPPTSTTTAPSSTTTQPGVAVPNVIGLKITAAHAALRAAGFPSVSLNMPCNKGTLASQSVVTNANLISKIYFPRLIVPASSVMVSLVDFLVACSILAGLMVWYHFWPTWRLIILPALVLLAIAAAVGPGLITTALTVKYRDFRILIPFVVQFGMYLCPIAYSSSLMREKLGEKWFLLYSVNPMVGVIDGFRWAILGTSASFDWHGFIISVVLTGVLLYIGIRYFRKIERVFADII